MTEKLYDFDAYLSEFSATVLSCNARADGTFDVVLDRTAFFPEGGGQDADTGTLGGAAVLDVAITDQKIVHRVDAPLTVGARVEGKIDFALRFEKMQCHSAEHIVSGILFSEYGYANVGFRLADDFVTIDTSGPLTRAELDRVENLANEAVFRNLPISARYPEKDELATMTYRSKLDLSDGVRIVTIPGIDVCACCAPHVLSTGEIGSIRLLDFEKHKNGVRIKMLAGRRALQYDRILYENVYRIATSLSVKQSESADAVMKLCGEIAALKSERRALSAERMKLLAERLAPTGTLTVVTLPGATGDDLLAYANAAMARIHGTLVLLSARPEVCDYLIASDALDLRTRVKDFNAALAGRGGGSSAMVRGTFYRNEEEVRAYFDALTL